MTRSRARTARLTLADRHAAIATASMLLLLAALGMALFTTLRSPLKDDVAWLLYVARGWLAGRELYVDVIEVNPPLIIWISALPIRLAKWTGLDSQVIAMPYFIAIILGFAWWTTCLLHKTSRLFTARLPVFAVLSSVLLLVPGADLGQREHLLVAAVLPYLVLFARRLDGDRPQLAASIAAGVLAGLGCALKPRYAGVFVALECLALLRGLRPWRVMPLCAAATLIGYAAIILLFCPAYVRRAVPLALALYGATDAPFSNLLLDSARLMFGQLVAAVLWWTGRRRLPDSNLMLTLLVFAVAATGICFLDGKNWFYHRLPATIATILALLLWGSSALLNRQREPRRALLPVLLAGVTLVVFVIAAYQRLQPEFAQAEQPEHSTVARLEALIHRYHARKYIAFSEWIALGFPVVNNTGVVWTSRFDSMWALKGELWRVRFDPSAAKTWPIRQWVAHDFVAGCPDLAVVDMRGGVNYVAELSSSDPDFARAWSRYREVDAFDGLVVYHRAAAGCTDLPPVPEAQIITAR